MKKILLIIHICVAVALQLTGYSYLVPPTVLRWAALGGYVFPFVLAATMACMLVALLTCRRHVLVHVVSLVVAYLPVTLYCPLNIRPSEPPIGALKVISYNSHGWGTAEPEDSTKQWDNGRQSMLYLAEQNADIVALQETGLNGGWAMRALYDSIIRPVYPYADTVQVNGHATLLLLSRHPIVRKQPIPFDTNGNGNGAAAFWVKVDDREVEVINCHLQTTGLTVAQREKFRSMVDGTKRDGVRTVSRDIFSQLLQSTLLRVPQAQTVSRFIRGHQPVLVMGDFNDTPLSYVHHVIAAPLTDCYRATALGPGYSFSRYGMRVRIDNVLCTTDITPHAFRVDNTIAASDHFPIVGWVSL